MKLFEFRGYGLPLGARVYPGIAGRGDTAPLEGTTTHPILNFQKVTVGLNPQMADAATQPPFGRQAQLYFEDFVGQQNRLQFAFTTPPSTRTTATSVYSARLYYRISALGDILLANQPPTVCRFLNGTTVQWQLLLTAWGFDPSNQYRPYILGVAGPPATGLQSLGTFRFEIQVDSSRSPSTVVRVYQGENTTPVWAEVRGTPAGVTADRIEIGDINGGFVNAFWLGDLEVHDDYDLGGQFTSNPTSPTAATTGATGKPYTAPTYTWSEWNGTSEVTLTDEGTWDGAAIDTSDPLVGEVFNRSLANVDYTSADYQYRSTPNQSLTLYKPTGTSPPGGWKTLVYFHSGFFTDGTRSSDLPTWFIEHCIHNGYALASCSYTLGTAMVGAPLQPATYPVWPNAGSGQYPSYFIDGKLAVRYLQQNAGTLGLNADEVATVGYSAGGYIAHAVNLSRDLADDGSGRNLTIQNSTYGITTTDADPVVVGSYSWGAPTNMQTAFDYDPTHPSYGPLNQGVGALRAAGAAFRGLAYNAIPNLTNTDLANMVTRNAANCAPVGYVRGVSDFLVHWAHEPLLEAACTAQSVPFTEYLSPTFHDNLLAEFNDVDLFNWLAPLMED